MSKTLVPKFINASGLIKVVSPFYFKH